MSERNAPRAGAIIVTFALPDESRFFTTSLTGGTTLHRGRPPALPTRTGKMGGRNVTVVHTGVGDTSAGRDRLQEVFAHTARPLVVISAGYAGGLAPRLRVGDLVLAENFSEPRLAELARRLLKEEPFYTGKLVSRDAVASTVAAKSALAAGTGALAVDMETGWIAEICRQRRVPLLSLRVISDAADQDFPVPGYILFDAMRQRPRYFALPAWLATHPGSIAPFAAFVRGLGTARARLTRALQILVAQI